jgi:hypothetical protein
MVVWYVLVALVISSYETVDVFDDICSCSCCIGFGCNLLQMPDFIMPLCRDDDGSCVRQCRTMFPAYCAHPYSQTFAICLNNRAQIAEQCVSVYALCLIAVITVFRRI